MKLDKIKEINCTLISKSGYPIYDLMQDIKPSDGNGGYVSGYVGATGTVFYTQDDTLLNKFRSLTSLQEKKDFLLENKSCLKKFLFLDLILIFMKAQKLSWRFCFLGLWKEGF